MTTEALGAALSDALAVFETADDPREPRAATEVADALGCTRRTAYNRLESLVEYDELATKKVGAKGRVWWRPVDASAVTSRSVDAVANAEATHADADAHLPAGVRGMVYRCRSEPGWPMTFVGDGAVELAEHDPDALESGDVSWGEDVIHPDDRDEVWRRVQDGLEQNGQFAVQYRIRTVGGETRWVWERGSAVDDEDADIEGVLTDVTALKEETLRLERERDDLRRELDDLFERVDDAFYALDESLRFTHVNDHAAGLLDATEDDLLDQRVWDAFERNQELADAFDQALLTQESDTIEFQYEPFDTWFEAFIYPSETGLSVYFRDVSDRVERKQQLEWYETMVETMEDGVYVVDGDGEFAFANQAYADMLGYDRSELVGSHVDRVVDEETIEQALAKEAQLEWDATTQATLEADLVTADGDTFPAEATFSLLPGGEETRRVGVVRDVTDRKQRERELRRQRERLRALNNVNEVVRDVNEALVQQSTREEVEQAVCDRLAESNSYQFAWIGEPDARSETVELRVEAGVENYLEDVTVTFDPDDSRSDGPTGRALRTGETQVTQEVADDPDYGPWHDLAETYDFQSSAAIPITYEGTTYGVLNVYADRADAFQAEERTVVGHLGDTIGHALASIDRKRALMGEEVVAVEFRVRGVFDTVGAESTDDTITFDRTVQLDDDEFLVYGTASEDAIATLEDVVEQVEHWVSVSVVSEGFGTIQFELRLSEPPVVSVLATHGGYIADAVIEDGDYEMTVHLPPDADVRSVTETVQDAYPTAEIVTREQVATESTTASLEGALATELTERQRTCLEAAYFSGFFESPRESSGKEVAESLGVTDSTFHQHVRKALATLLGTVFEHRIEDIE